MTPGAPPGPKPLRRWEDIAADMEKRGLSPERKLEVQKKYLDEWKQTEKPQAPAYTDSDLFPPKVLKYAEMQGRDAEALEAKGEYDPNENWLSRLARAGRSGLTSSPAAEIADVTGVADIPHERFEPRNMLEFVAKEAPRMVADPAMFVGGPVRKLAERTGSEGLKALAKHEAGTMFGVSGAEHEILKQARRGELPNWWETAKAGAKGFGLGALVGGAGKVGEDVASKVIPDQINRTAANVAQKAAGVAAEAGTLTAAGEVEQELTGPPRTMEQRLESVEESATKNAALFGALHLLGAMRSRRQPQVEGKAEGEKPPMASEVPQDMPGEPGTGAGSTPPEPRFVREMEREQAIEASRAQEQADETRYIRDPFTGVVSKQPIDLEMADVVPVPAVREQPGMPVSQEPPRVSREEPDFIEAEEVPETPAIQLPGPPPRQIPGSMQAQPALPAPGETSEYIPPEFYPREINWGGARGSSGPFLPRGQEPPPEPPGKGPAGPVAVSGPVEGTAPLPKKPAAPPRVPSAIREEIRKLDDRRMRTSSTADRVKLSGKIGRLKDELKLAEEASRKQLQEAHAATVARNEAARAAEQAEAEAKRIEQPQEPTEPELEEPGPAADRPEDVVPPPIEPEPAKPTAEPLSDVQKERIENANQLNVLLNRARAQNLPASDPIYGEIRDRATKHREALGGKREDTEPWTEKTLNDWLDANQRKGSQTGAAPSTKLSKFLRKDELEGVLRVEHAIRAEIGKAGISPRELDLRWPKALLDLGEKRQAVLSAAEMVATARRAVVKGYKGADPAKLAEWEKQLADRIQAAKGEGPPEGPIAEPPPAVPDVTSRVTPEPEPPKPPGPTAADVESQASRLGLTKQDIRQGQAKKELAVLGPRVEAVRRPYKIGPPVYVIDRATGKTLSRAWTYRDAVDQALKAGPGKQAEPVAPEATQAAVKRGRRRMYMFGPAGPSRPKAPEPTRSRIEELKEARERATTQEERDKLDREITLEGALTKTRKAEAPTPVDESAGEGEGTAAPESAPVGKGPKDDTDVTTDDIKADPGSPTYQAAITKKMRARDRALLREVEKEYELAERIDKDWTNEDFFSAKKEAYLNLGLALKWRNGLGPKTTAEKQRRAERAVRQAEKEVELYTSETEPEWSKAEREQGTPGESEVPFDVPPKPRGRPRKEREPGQEGMLAFGGRPKKKVDSSTGDPEVDGVFKDFEDQYLHPPTAIQKLEQGAKALVQHVKDGFGELFVFEHGLKDMPKLQYQMRRFDDVPKQTELRTEQDVFNIVNFRHPGEYQQLAKLVMLTDMAVRVEAGQSQPGDFPLERIERSMDTLWAKATPEVKLRVARYRALMRSEAAEDVKRGVLKPEALERAMYYPHRIIDYSNKLAGSGMFGSKLREPYRPWTKKALGSEKPFETNFIDVLYQHLMRVRLARETDDFAYTVLNEYDAHGKLTPKEQASINHANQRFEIDGKPYRTFAYKPGRQLAIDIGSTDGKVDAALDQLVPAQRYYVLPEAMADRMTRFRQSAETVKFARDLRRYLSLWKRVTLTGAGVGFQVRNVIDEAMTLIRDDPKALYNSLAKAGEIYRVLNERGKPEIMKILREQGITDATMFATEVGVEGLGRKLKKIERTGYMKPELVRDTSAKALETLERLAAKREMWTRVAKALTDIDRIQNNEQVKTTSIDPKRFEGLTPEQSVGLANTVLVDYGAVPPMFRKFVRGMFAPWATWYVQRLRDWPRYVKQHPEDALIKFGIPIAMLWYWNNYHQGDVERRNPDYVRRSLFHFNTGRKTEDGKDQVISLQTGLDAVAQMLLVDRSFDKLGRWARKDKPKWQDAKEFFRPKAWEAIEDANRVGLRMVPIANLAVGLATGKDPFTRRRIVDPSASRDVQAEQLAQFTLRQLAPFLGQYDNAIRKAEREGAAGQPARAVIDNLLDWQGGLGMLELDPQQGEIGAQSRDIAEAEDKRAAVLGEATEGILSGDREKTQQAIQEGAQTGTVGPYDLMNRLKRTGFLIEKTRRDMEAATTDEERKMLQDRLQKLKVMQQLENIQQRPKSARQAVMGR